MVGGCLITVEWIYLCGFPAPPCWWVFAKWLINEDNEGVGQVMTGKINDGVAAGVSGIRRRSSIGGSAAVAMELCHSDFLPKEPAVGGSGRIVISCYTLGFVLRPCPSFSAPSQYGTWWKPRAGWVQTGVGTFWWPVFAVGLCTSLAEAFLELHCRMMLLPVPHPFSPLSAPWCQRGILP